MLRSLALLGCAGFVIGCSSGPDATDTKDTGGVGTGGAMTGGAPTGGAPVGGALTGGAPMGGVPTGGVPAGGTPTGALPPAAGGGGDATGGEATGGAPPATCPDTATATPGDGTESVEGRTYQLHVPPSYDGAMPMPVVIDYHPLGSSGSAWAGNNNSEWRRKGDSEGFIVVHPESGPGDNSWNVGVCCQQAQQTQVDDVAITRAIVEHLKTDACIDSKRVYVTGCSNGGGMSYRAACDVADIIAAAAPVDFRCVYGGSTGAPSCDGCNPSLPITIVHFDNTGDTALVPHDRGMTGFAADCPPTGPARGWASRVRPTISLRGSRSTGARGPSRPRPGSA